MNSARGSGHDRSAASDRGSVTIFVAIASVGLLVLAGLVVDGGAKVRAAQRADRVAAEAARVGGQAIDISGVLAGRTIAVDRRAALAAANAYLQAAGIEGSARLVDGGAGMTVATSTSARTVFLGLVGVHTIAVRGHAEVSLVPSASGAF